MNHDHPNTPITPDRPAGRRRWKVAGIPITALVIAAGVAIAAVLVLTVGQHLGTITEHSSQTYHQVPDSVTVDGETAEIEVVGTADDQVTVNRQLEWARTEPDITETWRGQNLDIDLTCSGTIFFGWFNDVCRVNYRAEVPSSATLDLTATTGGITVSDIDSDIDATTTTGSVHGTELGAEQVTAQATTGSIELGFTTAPQQVNAKVTTGDIVITLPDDGQPYHVVGETQTGDREIRIATDPNSDRMIDISSTTGDVTIEYRD